MFFPVLTPALSLNNRVHTLKNNCQEREVLGKTRPNSPLHTERVDTTSLPMVHFRASVRAAMYEAR